jgi:hypothetical protein
MTSGSGRRFDLPPHRRRHTPYCGWSGKFTYVVAPALTRMPILPKPAYPDLDALTL